MNERFWQQTRRDGGCFLWTGRLDKCGYGRFSGRMAYKHAYEEAYGPVEPGYELDHLCRNRACVNPLHLQSVTRRENIMRSDNFAAVNARKTHCITGHEFTPENTYLFRGYRYCRICRAARERRRRSKQRELAQP